MHWKWTSKLSLVPSILRSLRNSKRMEAAMRPATGRQSQSARIFTCTALSMPSGKPTNRPISMRNLLYHAIIAAERGGKEVLKVQESGNLGIRSKSICFNPVTLGDMRSHLAMKGSLKQDFPSLCIISEEDDHCLDSIAVDLLQLPEEAPKTFLSKFDVEKDELVPMSDVTVWIDPLDGTQEFTEGCYENVTTMVGIAVRGRPVGGVIHQPFFGGRTYWGWEGHGVSLPLHIGGVHGHKSPFPRLVISKDPYRAGKVRDLVKRTFGEEPCELIPTGGAGYKLIQLLTGKCDGYIHLTENIKKWDTCAGHAIINALQGNLTTLDGRQIDYSTPFSAKNGTAVGSAFLATLENHQELLTKFNRTL